MKSWVTDITKAINHFRSERSFFLFFFKTCKFLSKTKHLVFRVPLKILWKRENKRTPSFILECIDFLSKHLEIEGIFRVNASVGTLNKFVLDIELGKKPNYAQTDPVVVAGALKQFFRGNLLS